MEPALAVPVIVLSPSYTSLTFSTPVVATVSVVLSVVVSVVVSASVLVSIVVELFVVVLSVLVFVLLSSVSLPEVVDVLP
ncbi:hypothetical protein D3C76_1606100 [compost metagenome]